MLDRDRRRWCAASSRQRSAPPTLNARIAEQKAVLEHSEPFAYAAQNLYAALSAADAAAATAFLSGGIQTPLMRARYQQALAAAASALADATAGAPTGRPARRWPRYRHSWPPTRSGRGRAGQQRAGFPDRIGLLARGVGLDADETASRRREDLLRRPRPSRPGQRRVGSLPTVGLVLLALVLVGIVIGSVILAAAPTGSSTSGCSSRRSSVLVAIAWIVVATRLAAGDIERSRSEGTARIEQLAKARILAQQARTDETLQLIRRGDITAGEKSFQATSTNYSPNSGPVRRPPWRASRDGPPATGSRCRPISTVTTRPRSHRRSAQIPAHRPPSSASWRRACVTRSRQTRAALREHVSTAGRALAWSPVGTLVLLALAGVATVLGLWPRLKEFL